MFSNIVQSKMVLPWLLLSLLPTMPRSHGQFATVLNIPPDPDIGDFQSIGSDTQVNLGPGGVIGRGFESGIPSGATNNVEVNISGGLVGREFTAYTGSITNISGGIFDRAFRIKGGSELNIFGNNFRTNAGPVAGLENVGDSVTIDARLLMGTFADGTPFAFTPPDFFYGSIRFDSFGSVTLTATALPPVVGPTLITAPNDPIPHRIRDGQTIVVESNGVIGDNFRAGMGSTVVVNDGMIGENFEAFGSQVTITGGTFADSFSAYSESDVSISGGSFRAAIFTESTANISGGTLGSAGPGRGVLANYGSTVNITGGSMNIRAYVGSTVNIFGGDYSQSGDAIVAETFSNVNVFGSQFILAGVDITDTLTPNVPFTIEDRNIDLEGSFLDGTSFKFQVFAREEFSGAFDKNAILTVTLLVPEPTSALLLTATLSMFLTRRMW